MRVLLSMLLTIFSVTLAQAGPTKVTLWTGDHYSADLDRIQALQETVVAQSDTPTIVTAEFKKSDNGTVFIKAGDKAGTAVVTVTGRARALRAGIFKRKKAQPLGSQAFEMKFLVTVVKAESKQVFLKIAEGQIFDIKMGKGEKVLGKSFKNSNPGAAIAKRRISNAIYVKGLKAGKTVVDFKYTVKGKGKQPAKNMRGRIDIHVLPKEFRETRREKRLWSKMGPATGQIIIVDPDKDKKKETKKDGVKVGSLLPDDCGNGSAVAVAATVGFGSFLGATDPGTQIGVEGRLAFSRISHDFFQNFPDADETYVSVGISRFSYDGSDMYIDAVDGFTLRGGVGRDCWRGTEPLGANGWCWGLGGQANVVLTSADAEGGDSTTAIGVGASGGLRAESKTSGWGLEADLGLDLYLNEIEVGNDSSRLGFGASVRVTRGF